MDLEQQLKDTYAEHLGALDVPVGDLGVARRTGMRMRVRRRLTAAAAAAAVVAVAIGGSMLGTGRISIGPSDDRGSWRELPAPPLSPRAYAESVWTGREVIVLGGEKNPCPPSADCAVASDQLRDGAAYNPQTDTWRAIPPAPVPVGPGDRLVVADGVVVLRHWRQGGSDWFTYEPDHNRWSVIDDVPPGIGDLPSAIGSKVYAIAGRRVAVYDVTRLSWRLLPPDPIEPRLRQQRITATASGPVVTGYDATQPNDGRSPSVVLADVWDGSEWRRLPATGQLGNNWFWTGDRMVDPEPNQGDNGEVDSAGQRYPVGGVLDPATGAWARLPGTVAIEGGGWGVNAQAGRWSAVFGQVYDTETAKVWTLPAPDGASDLLGTTAVWADDSLVVFGGVAYGPDVPAGTVTNHTWLYTP